MPFPNTRRQPCRLRCPRRRSSTCSTGGPASPVSSSSPGFSSRASRPRRPSQASTRRYQIIGCVVTSEVQCGALSHVRSTGAAMSASKDYLCLAKSTALPSLAQSSYFLPCLVLQRAASMYVNVEGCAATRRPGRGPCHGSPASSSSALRSSTVPPSSSSSSRWRNPRCRCSPVVACACRQPRAWTAPLQLPQARLYYIIVLFHYYYYYLITMHSWSWGDGCERA